MEIQTSVPVGSGIYSEAPTTAKWRGHVIRTLKTHPVSFCLSNSLSLLSSLSVSISLSLSLCLYLSVSLSLSLCLSLSLSLSPSLSPPLYLYLSLPLSPLYLPLYLRSAQRRQKKPTITTPLQNTTVNVGDTVTLRCVGSSRPAPNIGIGARGDSSFMVDTPPKRRRQKEEETRDAVIVLRDVTEEDGGWYDCKVVNQKGTAVSSAYITVKKDPCDLGCPGEYDVVCATDCKVYYSECIMKESSCRNKSDLKILNKGYCSAKISSPVIGTTTTATALNGGRARLTVSVSGFPEPEVTWYKREGAAKQKIGTGSTVSVYEPGTYFATAKNCIERFANSREIEVADESAESPTSPLPGTTTYLTDTPDNIEVIVEDGDISEIDLAAMDHCTMLGGGNVITFDDWRYEFEGECSYVLAMDCDFASWFVYVRFSECATGRCLDTLTVIDGTTQLPVVRGWAMSDYGQKVEYREGEVVRIGGISAKLKNEQLTLTMRGGVKVVYDGYSVVHVFVPKGSMTCGICGNNDGDSSNDVVQGRRRYQTEQEMANFVDSWRIRSPSHETRCTPVTEKTLRPSYTCSDDNLRREESVNCRKLYSLLDNTCFDTRQLRFMFDSCRYDACYGEEPLEGYSRACYTGRAMATLCGTDFTEWENLLECGTKNDTKSQIEILLKH
eukprot:sb/3462747/